MSLTKLARHGSIDGILDYQATSDTMSSIRNQIDVWCLKKWNKQLAGDQFDWIFPVIKAKRDYIAEKYRYSKAGWKRADSSYPMIESLNKTWFYGLIAGYKPKLFPVPPLGIKHKEPTDKWTKITGIKLDHDISMIESASNTSRSKVSKKDDRTLFQEMVKLKAVKGSTWDSIVESLSKQQEDGKLVCSIDLSNASGTTLSSKFSRMKKKYVTEKE
jgi:hypothetical protein